MVLKFAGCYDGVWTTQERRLTTHGFSHQAETMAPKSGGHWC